MLYRQVGGYRGCRVRPSKRFHDLFYKIYNELERSCLPFKTLSIAEKAQFRFSLDAEVCLKSLFLYNGGGIELSYVRDCGPPRNQYIYMKEVSPSRDDTTLLSKIKGRFPELRGPFKLYE